MLTGIPHGSEAWWDARADRIGASEIGAVLGIDHYRSPLKLFMGKKLEKKQRPKEDHRDWGNDVEPAILHNFARRNGYRLVEKIGLLTDPKRPHLCATPDGVGIRDGRARDLQAKNVEEHHTREWGEPGTSDAPLLYVAQVTIELGVLRARQEEIGAPIDDDGDLVVSFGGRPPLGYPIPFNEELFGNLSEAAAKFVRDYLVPNKPPPIKGDPAALEYVKRRFAKSTGELLQPTDEAMALVNKLRLAKAEADADKTVIEQLQAQLCALIGNAYGFEGWCTWSVVKEQRSTITDWPMVVEKLANAGQFGREFVQKIVAEFTREEVTKESYRRLSLAKERKAK